MRHRPVNALFCRCGEPWGDYECSTACASCHKPVVAEGVKACRCGECWHAWRWGWLLSLHDARTYWRLGQCVGTSDAYDDWCIPWWKPWQRIRLRRPSKIWVCPCCSHDL